MVLTLIYLVIYMWVTPHHEINLIRENNLAAALALAGSLVGFSLPLTSAIANSVALVDCAIWGLIAIVVQSVVDAVIKAAPSEIPAIMMQGIEGGLSNLTSFDFGNVQFDGGKGLQNVVKSISDIGKSSGGKDVSDTLKGIGEGIGDLFNGGEKKDPPEKTAD